MDWEQQPRSRGGAGANGNYATPRRHNENLRAVRDSNQQGRGQQHYRTPDRGRGRERGWNQYTPQNNTPQSAITSQAEPAFGNTVNGNGRLPPSGPRNSQEQAYRGGRNGYHQGTRGDHTYQSHTQQSFANPFGEAPGDSLNSSPPHSSQSWRGKTQRGRYSEHQQNTRGERQAGPQRRRSVEREWLHQANIPPGPRRRSFQDTEVENQDHHIRGRGRGRGQDRSRKRAYSGGRDTTRGPFVDNTDEGLENAQKESLQTYLQELLAENPQIVGALEQSEELDQLPDLDTTEPTRHNPLFGSRVTYPAALTNDLGGLACRMVSQDFDELPDEAPNLSNSPQSPNDLELQDLEALPDDRSLDHIPHGSNEAQPLQITSAQLHQVFESGIHAFASGGYLGNSAFSLEQVQTLVFGAIAGARQAEYDDYLQIADPAHLNLVSYSTTSAIQPATATSIPEKRIITGNTEKLFERSVKTISATPQTLSTEVAANMSLIEQFLSGLSGIVRDRDGARIQDFLLIEPPFNNNDLYIQLIDQLRNQYSQGSEEQLQNLCDRAFVEVLDDSEPDSSPWTAFVRFMVEYFTFLRDVDVSNLLKTYEMLAELVKKANSALSNSKYGIMILPTLISYGRMLARLAIGLDKRPDLIAHLITADSDGEERQSLAELAAGVLRPAFNTCLNDRSSAPGKAEGKKVGIYSVANLCLKILFQCNKPRAAEQFFTQIYLASPPLALYPRSQRVTYLYYLGLFYFTTNHFYRAQLALQEAFDQCHRGADYTKQRRRILILLITSNIIMGRFPSLELYSLPEAYGFQERFLPLCHAIAKGNLLAFRLLTDFNAREADWFMRHRIFLQLRNRCEVLVWRSLIRRVFLLNGNPGDVDRKIAPSLDLKDVLHVFRLLEKKALTPMSQADFGPGRRNGNYVITHQLDEPPKSAIYIDPDFIGMEDGEGEHDDEADENPHNLPTMTTIESILSSLLEQGLLNGYLRHSREVFALGGAKRSGALAGGFPNVWSVVSAKMDDEVPGWKQNGPGMGVMGAFGGGGIVHLSGARPAGLN